MLPRFLQTAPRGHRPCASLALCLHQTWAEDLHLQAVKHARHTHRRGKCARGIEKGCHIGKARSPPRFGRRRAPPTGTTRIIVDVDLHTRFLRGVSFQCRRGGVHLRAAGRCNCSGGTRWLAVVGSSTPVRWPPTSTAGAFRSDDEPRTAKTSAAIAGSALAARQPTSGRAPANRPATRTRSRGNVSAGVRCNWASRRWRRPADARRQARPCG